MTKILIDIAVALWFIFPAYCANGAPVIFGGGKPMDFGKNFVDGKPLFGSHKTFRGFFVGIIIGTLVGLIQTIIYEQVLFQYGPQFQYSILLGFMISVGAVTGDLIESCIKRRLNRSPGSNLPIADQLDFILGAFLFSIPVSPPSLVSALIILLITIPTHWLTNLGAALLNMKNKRKNK
ncbi:MAG: CDP-2,3-bis-(O-geranylgeranyl)-sn-glycerol synthase [Candidatus Bathyarchaeota archaeon]|nr:CDP-2,3-bis-(O-geranylgeranyl)-sn-glycerol synthase [Candidatus Bathyarchaeum tardum]WNZ30274.1 MAG: CDP-2,3-bis-(O-geranylgeranyl)-sn-glycerol synthase [Candidatus Bathyarchaeota archaeon]